MKWPQDVPRILVISGVITRIKSRKYMGDWVHLQYKLQLVVITLLRTGFAFERKNWMKSKLASQWG